MPLTPEELRRFVALERLVGDLKKSLDAVTTRIEVLEQASEPPPWERLLAAVNQFGDFHFGQLANQTLAPKPARPWKEV